MTQLPIPGEMPVDLKNDLAALTPTLRQTVLGMLTGRPDKWEGHGPKRRTPRPRPKPGPKPVRDVVKIANRPAPKMLALPVVRPGPCRSQGALVSRCEFDDWRRDTYRCDDPASGWEKIRPGSQCERCNEYVERKDEPAAGP